MLPTVGFEDHEWPSGIRPRVPLANYRQELAEWFGGPHDTSPAPALKAVGTTDAAPPVAPVMPIREATPEAPSSRRMPFLIF